MAALTSVPAGVHNRPCVGARPIASDRLMCRSLNSRKVRTVPRSTAAPPAQAKTGETSKQVIDDERKYILQTYARTPIVLSHGSGAKLYDVEGNEYLDFTSGIAVNALGHADPRWVETVSEQAALLAHTSNLFHSLPQVELARRLVENSFADKVFFANSGTEANEAAIKFARKFAKVQAGVDPYNPEEAARAPSDLLGFTGSFHGRTLGALSLTYKSQYRTPFSPLTPGSKLVPYGDLAATRAELASGSYAGVFVEPVQGEGGINDAGSDFLKGLRALCDEFGVLLVFDEVQVGLGRTGHLFAYERSGVEPDLMTLAKPLAGGLPIGAVLLKQHVADTMAPGDHGSTFAGNPLVCKAAITTLDIIRDPAFLADVRHKGEALKEGLTRALKGNPHVEDVRGAGLLIGIQLDRPAGKVVEAAKQRGLLILTAGKGDVVRLAPPLVVSHEEVQQAIQIISEAVAETLV